MGCKDLRFCSTRIIQSGNGHISPVLPEKIASDMKEGKVDINSADPVSCQLMITFWELCIKEGNVFVWVYSLLQWNCMGRSISISSLGLHCMSYQDDYLKVLYDKTKCDQTGQKVTDKNLYSNPYNPNADLYLALGIWFFFQRSNFKEDGLLFGKTKLKERNASQNYSNQFFHLKDRNKNLLSLYCKDLDRIKTHSIRKGAATNANSGSTMPPSLASICNRGDWHLGSSLDVYFHFCEAGDHYLGRVLSGLDPNSSQFATLPPHFKTTSPLEDDDIKRGLDLMYGPILTLWRGGNMIQLV